MKTRSLRLQGIATAAAASLLLQGCTNGLFRADAVIAAEKAQAVDVDPAAAARARVAECERTSDAPEECEMHEEIERDLMAAKSAQANRLVAN